MTAPPHFAGAAALAMLIFAGCRDSESERAEQPITGDTTMASAVEPGLATQVAPQDTGGWIPGAAALHEPRSGTRPAVLSTVEASAHAEYDRVIFAFSTKQVPGYHLEYTQEAVRECGSGQEVSVAGTGRLVVRLEPAQAHDDQGQVTIHERALAPVLPVLKEMKLLCDFEGQVQWVLAVSSPTAYRVHELDAPPRLVVDIRHDIR